MLAVDAVEDARLGCAELEEIAGAYEGGMVGALAAHARGAFELANGNPQTALGRCAELRSPGRSSELPTRLRALGCWSGSRAKRSGTATLPTMELDAARTVFAELGAEPDLERVGKPGATGKPA